MLTAKELRKLLRYDENTGYFYWNDNGTFKVKTGDVAGVVDSNGYRIITVHNKPYKAHRLVWLYLYGTFPTNYLDHINHNKDDNRICNLREVDCVENARNRLLANNNHSGVTGVHWSSANRKWKAQIKVNGELIYLGYFSDFNEAVRARKSVEQKYGFFAKEDYNNVDF